MNPEAYAIYIEATKLAQKHGQIVGEKNEYYITLRQLERLIEIIEEPKE